MIPGFLFAALAALADVAGGLLVTTRIRHSTAALNTLVGFGAGFMLSVALLEMLPNAFEVEHGLFAVLLGYLAVHLTQHVMTPHFHFGEETHEVGAKSVGVWALVGLVPHSFFDGVAIAGGYLVSAEVGFLIFVAVALHKIPTGVSLASIMLASGNTIRSALVAVLMLALATLLGALLTPAIDMLAHYGLAVAAGVTIYVAASNLIPESQRAEGWFVPAAVFIGVIGFALIRAFLPGH